MEDLILAFTAKGFTLYARDVTLHDGRVRKHYFFSRHHPDADPQEGVPKGYRVGINRRTQMPYLKAVARASASRSPKPRKSPVGNTMAARKAKKAKRKAPKRKAAKKKAAKRKAPKRKAAKRKSSKRKSAKRKAPKRKAAKKKAPKRKAAKRKSSKRKSAKRKAPKRKAAKKK